MDITTTRMIFRPCRRAVCSSSGHTHVKMDEVRDRIRCLNPGSVSIPKDGSHSCLIYENGEFSFRILEG